MRRRQLFVLAVAAVMAAVTASVVHADDPNGSMSDRVSLRQLAGVNFVSTCRFSHRAGDDPIVFPGCAGVSHDHSFVGNVSTNASSTLGSLLAAGRRAGARATRPRTGCRRCSSTERRSSPSGRRSTTGAHTLAPTQPVSSRLEIVAGNSQATEAAGPPDHASGTAASSRGVGRSAPRPTCPERARPAGLRLHVTFPTAGTARTSTAPITTSHMAYSDARACPSGYPVRGAGDLRSSSATRRPAGRARRSRPAAV